MNRGERQVLSRCAAVLDKLQMRSASNPADIAAVAKFNAFAPVVMRQVMNALWAVDVDVEGANFSLQVAEQEIAERWKT